MVNETANSGVKVSAVLNTDGRAAMESFCSRHSTKMLVVVFTDVEGSVKLRDRLGDDKVRAMLAEHERLMMAAVGETEDGEVISSSGDSYLFVFLKPSAAVRFAVRALVRHCEARGSDWPELAEFRVGIHLGSVVADEGPGGSRFDGPTADIQGFQVDTAARIMGLARGGQVLCSRAVCDDARHDLKGVGIEGVGELFWESHGLYELKGREEPMEVCEVGRASAGPMGKPAGSGKARAVGLSCEVMKRREDQFIARLRDNLGELAGSRSPEGAGAGAAVRAGDEMTVLRRLTGGQMLRGELEKKYPLGKSLSVRLTKEQGGLFSRKRQGGGTTVVCGKVMLRLERIVESGSDSEPMGLAELDDVLARESDQAGRGRYSSVLGLYSPTGWAQEALEYVENDPAGSGWASTNVSAILIGPTVTESVWDSKDEQAGEYASCFAGYTEAERVEACKQAIKRMLSVQEFADLARLAAQKGIALAMVQKVAEMLLDEEDGLKLTNVRDVGLVLKRMSR